MTSSEKPKKQADALLVDEKDNVGIALRELSPGEQVTVFQHVSIRIQSVIPIFHKFALKRIERDEPIIKYGEEIGRASTTIEPGEHVHLHNLICDRGMGLRSKT